MEKQQREKARVEYEHHKAHEKYNSYNKTLQNKVKHLLQMVK